MNLEMLHEIDPSNKQLKKNLLFKMSKAHFESKKDFSSAVHYATEALKLKPGFTDALLIRAKTYYKLKRYNDSLADLDTILKTKIGVRLRKSVSSLKMEIEIAQEENMETSNKENTGSQSFDTSYSSKNLHPEKVDNRNFFNNFDSSKKQQKSNSSEQSYRASSSYSFSSSDRKNFKEYMGKPQPKASSKSYQQQQNENEAAEKNKKGRQEYLANRFESAAKFFSEALNKWPTNVFYLTNRSACYMHMDKQELALVDGIKAIEADPSFYKGYLRIINCFLALGNFNLAEDYVERFKNNIVGVDSIKSNEIPKVKLLKESHPKIIELYNAKNYEECLKHLENVIAIASSCNEYRNMKVECLIMLEKHNEANFIIAEAFAKNKRDSNMIYIQGLQFYYRNELESSIERFESAIRVDPSLKKAKDARNNAREIIKLYQEGKWFNKFKMYYISENINLLLGIKHFKANVFHDAREAFTSAANVDPTNKKVIQIMMYNCGSANFELTRYKDALDNFTVALRINETHTKSLSKRAHCHHKLTEYEDCIIDCEELLKLEPSEETKKLMDDAKWSISVRKGTSRYNILGVTSKSTIKEIKNQFHKLSLLYHTDKHPDATEVEKRKLKRKFEEIRDAYNFVVAVHVL